MRVFNEWAEDFSEVQKNSKIQFGSATDKRKFAAKAEKQKSTSFAPEAHEKSNQKSDSPMKEGEHKRWNCNMNDVDK